MRLTRAASADRSPLGKSSNGGPSVTRYPCPACSRCWKKGITAAVCLHLDHCEDPARALVEMYRACRVRGQVWVLSIENEGERERYAGLHQWNLFAADATLRLWNPRTDRNLLDLLPGPFAFTWRYVHEEPTMRVFLATIHKRRADAPRVGP